MEDRTSITIDTEEIEEFVHAELIKRGMVPSSSEVAELADVFFDLLLHKKIIEER
ncbi:YozD family protein [Priestia megaterium]|uniref:YozD family protein n=1 Tax=Priestia megaterium TaxID=1404 RepID=UPI00367150E6